jgi:hypothetical protein
MSSSPNGRKAEDEAGVSLPVDSTQNGALTTPTSVAGINLPAETEQGALITPTDSTSGAGLMASQQGGAACSDPQGESQNGDMITEQSAEASENRQTGRTGEPASGKPAPARAGEADEAAKQEDDAEMAELLCVAEEEENDLLGVPSAEERAQAPEQRDSELAKAADLRLPKSTQSEEDLIIDDDEAHTEDDDSSYDGDVDIIPFDPLDEDDDRYKEEIQAAYLTLMARGASPQGGFPCGNSCGKTLQTRVKLQEHLFDCEFRMRFVCPARGCENIYTFKKDCRKHYPAQPLSYHKQWRWCHN